MQVIRLGDSFTIFGIFIFPLYVSFKALTESEGTCTQLCDQTTYGFRKIHLRPLNYILLPIGNGRISLMNI